MFSFRSRRIGIRFHSESTAQHFGVEFHCKSICNISTYRLDVYTFRHRGRNPTADRERVTRRSWKWTTSGNRDLFWQSTRSSRSPRLPKINPSAAEGRFDAALCSIHTVPSSATRRRQRPPCDAIHWARLDSSLRCATRRERERERKKETKNVESCGKAIRQRQTNKLQRTSSTSYDRWLRRTKSNRSSSRDTCVCRSTVNHSKLLRLTDGRKEGRRRNTNSLFEVGKRSLWCSSWCYSYSYSWSSFVRVGVCADRARPRMLTLLL